MIAAILEGILFACVAAVDSAISFFRGHGMTDIIERLRDWNGPNARKEMLEATSEIERLRDEVANLRAELRSAEREIDEG